MTTLQAASLAPSWPAADVEFLRQVVQDWAGIYFGGPMALTRDDAVRYTVEGHLRDLTTVHGYRSVRDVVEAHLVDHPELLEHASTGEQRAARNQDRADRAGVEARAAATAVTEGRYRDALAHVDAAELAHPRARDYEQVRERIRSSAPADTAEDRLPPPAPPGPPVPPSSAEMLSGQPEDLRRSIDQLRADVAAARTALDAARSALDTALAQVPAQSGPQRSVAAAAMDLVDAVVAAAGHHLVPVMEQWENVDAGWQRLRHACGLLLAGDAHPGPTAERVVRDVVVRVAELINEWVSRWLAQPQPHPSATLTSHTLHEVTVHTRRLIDDLGVRLVDDLDVRPATGAVPGPADLPDLSTRVPSDQTRRGPGTDPGDFRDIREAFAALRSSLADPDPGPCPPNPAVTRSPHRLSAPTSVSG